MEYKLVTKLTTKQVEEYEEAYFGQGLDDKPILTRSAGAVRAAAKWYDGPVPNPDEIEPAEVVNLCTDIYLLYSKALGLNFPNLQARSRTSRKK
jgi:hypothetical protein